MFSVDIILVFPYQSWTQSRHARIIQIFHNNHYLYCKKQLIESSFTHNSNLSQEPLSMLQKTIDRKFIHTEETIEGINRKHHS